MTKLVRICVSAAAIFFANGASANDLVVNSDGSTARVDGQWLRMQNGTSGRIDGGRVWMPDGSVGYINDGRVWAQPAPPLPYPTVVVTVDTDLYDPYPVYVQPVAYPTYDSSTEQPSPPLVAPPLPALVPPPARTQRARTVTGQLLDPYPIIDPYTSTVLDPYASTAMPLLDPYAEKLLDPYPASVAPAHHKRTKHAE